jgi:protein TonB
MFEQTFIQTPAQTRKPWTVAVSLSVQCLAVTILLLIPLLHTETLRLPDPPQPRLIRTWITQPPVPPQKTAPRSTALSVPSASRPVFVVPSVHPASARTIDVPSADSEPATWSGPAGTTFVSPLGTGTLPSRTDLQKSANPPEAKPVVSGPFRVSGGVEGAKLVFGPHPVYPTIAKAARSQGVVKLEAIIAADGNIRNLRVVSGPPLLVNAAVDAVRQWRYQPTLLNGIAVEVLTEIDVNFSLTN